MRTHVNRSVADRPETHALVLGIGTYPYLKDGGSTRFRHAGTLGQLTSPPISAVSFGDWLQRSYASPSAPLGTLELLVSDAADSPQDAPTMENIRTAVLAWRRRADARGDNLALFYFCGHGLSAGVHDGLLAADFGDRDEAVLRHVIDINGLQLAMDGCRARQQVFFVDACRSSPRWLGDLVIEGGIGDPILDPVRQGQLGRRDAPRFFSTLPNQPAYGRRNRPSLFTEALLEALDSAGAERIGSRWIVRTDTLLAGLNQMLRALAEQEHLPLQSAMLDRASGFDFHLLPAPPEVHVTISCRPASANPVADLSVRRSGGEWCDRGPKDASPWRLRRAAGVYDIRVTFGGGEFKDETRDNEVVWTPTCDLTLDV